MSEPSSGPAARRSIHVLHVIDSLSPFGGAERGLAREVSRFDQVSSTVVVLSGRSPLRSVLADAGVEVIELDVIRGPLVSWLPVAVWRVARAVRRARPDVVHTSLFQGNLVGQAAAMLTRVPVVSALVSSGDRYSTANASVSRSQAILLRLGRMVARLAHPRYRALTRHAAESNATLYRLRPEEVTVIPRGVELDALAAPPTPERSRRLPGSPAFINVGRHVTAKAQWDLIEAFAAVVQELPEARLSIVGKTGPTTERLQAKIAEHDLAGSVELLDTVDDIAPLLHGSDVFAFSSHHEGLGTAVLEALAVGLPVVSYDIPSVREVTDDGRLASLAPLGDVPALAAALVDAARRPGDEAGVQDRRSWIARRFAIEVVAAEVEALLISAARPQSN